MAECNIVITDRHHGSLYLSHIYLFQKRLGFDLRFPFGLDWAEKKYFEYSNPDFTKGILTCAPLEKETDPDKIFNYGAGGIGTPITLEEAIDRGSEIRFLVSSLHESEPCFARFINDHAPDATLIRECGNPNERVRFTRHALCSDLETYNRIKRSHHAVLYHQEFNRHIFSFRQVDLRARPRKVRTYLNYLADNPTLRLAWEKLASLFDPKDAQFYMHGLKDEKTPNHGWNGAPGDIREMALMMADSAMTVSCKHWDGYGHVVHCSYAIGRPVICRFGDYEAKLGGRLIEDMVSGIKLTGCWPIDKKKIESVLLNDQRLAEMVWAATLKFNKWVNFDEDEKRIREWLKKL